MKGVLINVSSISSQLPGCRLASVYSATKAYVSNLSQTLSKEYASRGVVVQCLSPGMVDTKLIPASTKERSRGSVVSPAAVVDISLGLIGVEDRLNGHWKHEMTRLFAEWAPRLMDRLLSRRTQDYMRRTGGDFNNCNLAQ